MKKILLFLLPLISFYGFGFELIPTQTLLLAYLENDLELQNLTIAAQKADLSLEYAECTNGFDVTLSSGSVTLIPSADGTTITANPSITMSLPQASNLSLSAESELSADSGEGTSEVSDTSLALGVDIISTNALSRKVSLLKAERSKTEAYRELENQALEAENAFYTELKDILTSIKTLIKAEQTLYSDTIDFEEIKAEGYSATSSSYRLAEMQVLSDKHTVESYLRDLIHDYIVFYKKCGYDITLNRNQDYLELIPEDFESVDPLDVLSFAKEDYVEIENAVWTNQINTMERKCDSYFTLSASGGYTFANSTTDSDTVDAGLSASLGGLALDAGLSLPVSGDSSPALTMGITLTPFSFKKKAIEKKQASLTEEEELLDIQAAEQDYENYLVSAIQDLEGLLWEKDSAQENYEMYSKLSDELADWYKQGIITESEYLSAKANAAMYRVELLINQLDMIIYNADIKCNFLGEGEYLKGENV